MGINVGIFGVEKNDSGHKNSFFRVKVTPTTFWLKCKNLPKCTKFYSIRKLEVAAKNFGVLTKNRLMHWQVLGLKVSISGNSVLYALHSNFVCGNRCTHVILLPIGPQQSLLMIIWDLNLFPSSLKASTSNFRIFFVGSLVFTLRLKKFPTTNFFLIWQKILSTSTDDKYELI